MTIIIIYRGTSDGQAPLRIGKRVRGTRIVACNVGNTKRRHATRLGLAGLGEKLDRQCVGMWVEKKKSEKENIASDR